jgi:hypothetical protein
VGRGVPRKGAALTTVTTEENALFYAEPPPQTDDVQALRAWTFRQFERLQSWSRRPQAAGFVFSMITSNIDPEFKAEDGLMLYAGPGVLGPNEGIYVREGGTWKKVT